MSKLKNKIISAIFLVGVAALSTLSLPILEDNIFKRQVFDLWTKLNDQEYQSNNIFSIEFDQEALLEIGYPVTRATHATLLEKINNLRPKVVAYDVIFGASKDTKGTQLLASAMHKSHASVILAASINEQGTIDGPEASLLLDSKVHHGIVDGHLDSDGTYRWYSLIHASSSGFLPSLALQSYLQKNGYDYSVVQDDYDNVVGIKITQNDHQKHYFDLTSDPMKMGRIALRPRTQSYAVKKYSWSEILNKDFQTPDEFRDGIFLIGLTVSGVASHQGTAMDPTQLALHNHKFVIQDLQEARHLKPWSWKNYFFIFWTVLVMMVFTIRKPFGYYTIATLIICSFTALLAISFVQWQLDYLWIPQSEIITLMAGAVVGFMRRTSDEENQREVLRKSFSTYLHPSLVKDLMEQASMVKLGGEERELTLFFSDLRNFTSLSEKVSSTELVSIMNEYFTIVTKHIQESGGTVDKFIGDAVMAFWNAPVLQESHAEKALQAIDCIRNDFKYFSSKWKAKLNLQEEISLGIGLHTGRAVVGNIGGDNRFNYTALGDSVNLASRLEGICKVYSVDIIVSGDLINQISLVSRKDWVEIDTIQVKGQSRDVSIYTRNTLTPEQKKIWDFMLSAWRSGDMNSVKNHLNDIISPFGPADTFRHRLESLHTFPPDWKGTWKMHAK